MIEHSEILELPGNSRQSELHFFTPNADQAQSLPKTMAWMNGDSFPVLAVIWSSYLVSGQGIYHGNMNLTSNTDDFIDSAQLLPYPPSEASPNDEPLTPISINLTEFHFVLLYKDRIVGICNLNDELVYEEMLPLVRQFSFCCWINCLTVVVEAD